MSEGTFPGRLRIVIALHVANTLILVVGVVLAMAVYRREGFSSAGEGFAAFLSHPVVALSTLGGFAALNVYLAISLARGKPRARSVSIAYWAFMAIAPALTLLTFALSVLVDRPTAASKGIGAALRLCLYMGALHLLRSTPVRAFFSGK